MITRFFTWISQTLCSWSGHSYLYGNDGCVKCMHCEKEMPDDEF